MYLFASPCSLAPLPACPLSVSWAPSHWCCRWLAKIPSDPPRCSLSYHGTSRLLVAALIGLEDLVQRRVRRGREMMRGGRRGYLSLVDVFVAERSSVGVAKALAEGEETPGAVENRRTDLAPQRPQRDHLHSQGHPRQMSRERVRESRSTGSRYARGVRNRYIVASTRTSTGYTVTL